jgi:hypothetical protein
MLSDGRRSGRGKSLVLLLIVTACLLLWGCGSSGGEDVVNLTGAGPDGGAPADATAQVIYNPTLVGEAVAGIEPVSENVTAFQITGYDAGGEVVYGPASFDKVPIVDLDLPITTTSLKIEDMAGPTAVGEFQVNLDLSEGATVLLTDNDLIPVNGPDNGGGLTGAP